MQKIQVPSLILFSYVRILYISFTLYAHHVKNSNQKVLSVHKLYTKQQPIINILHFSCDLERIFIFSDFMFFSCIRSELYRLYYDIWMKNVVLVHG